MNKNVLKANVQDFIKTNLEANIYEVLLKKSPFEQVSIQELVNQIIGKQKAKTKLPTWFKTENIYYPEKISIEQTSSEITAKHKADLLSGTHLVDITGGFGIDAFYFSKRFKRVTHCEINTGLSQIVAHNYKALETENITTKNIDGLQFLENNDQKFDVIYVDPSRRNDAKGKVFLLKDCLPNIPENLEFLLTKSDTILIKNSPILDISATIKQLKFVKEIQIIAVKNEVKELLFLLEKDYQDNIQIKTFHYYQNKQHYFAFEKGAKTDVTYNLPKAFLYEPNSAILKSGGFNAVAEKFSVFKLHQHSHLYTSEEKLKFPGRSFHILEVLPYDKKKLLKLLPKKKANITVRNFPKTVAQIRKETKIKDGGDIYLFFTKLMDDKNAVIVCKK